MENGKFEDFQAYVEKTLLEIANCSQASIYLINQKRNVSINKLFEENSLEIGIIGQVALTSESLFLQDCQSYHKFNQLVDFKSNLPVHTYPIKDSNSLIIAVIQLIRFRDILGKKIKKDLEEEDILARFLTCLGVLYEKINVKLKIFD